ncbi:MAG TPA: hypothetical protein VNL14_02725 [Candidatus Acidoferrales bacterium]|nr:hypothetical protein [Candidatus Acidoferrales bacterium]
MLSWLAPLAALLLGLARSSTPPVLAATSTVNLEAEVGFAGRFQLGHPFPLEITLHNAGATTDGTVEVQVWKRGGAKGIDSYPVYHRKQVFLPAQTQKKVRFTIDPDFLSRPLSATLTTPTARARREIDLRAHFSTRPLVLLVSGAPAPLTLPLPQGFASPVVKVPLSELPADPRAYLGVWAAIFYEQPLRELSRAQVFALEEWLLWGGRLLAIAGLNEAVFDDANWARFLPVRVAGRHRIARPETLQKAYGPLPAGEVWAYGAAVVKGKPLLQEQRLTIAAEASRGQGKVVFLSLDIGRPPLARWAGLPKLFSELLGAPPEFRVTWAAAWDDNAFARLLSSRSFLPYYAPATSFAAWLLAYAAAVGLALGYGRKRGVGRRFLIGAWLAIVFCFSVAGYVYFDRGGKPLDGVLFEAVLLEPWSEGYAEAQANIALFSTRQRPYRVKLENGWSHLEMVSPVGAKESSPPLGIASDGASSELDIGVGEWSYKLFRVRAAVPLALSADARARGDRVELEIANHSGRSFAGCWFVVAGKAFFVGDVPARARIVRDFPRGDKAQSSRRGLGDISFDDPVRDFLFRHVFFSDQARPRDMGGGAVFFGWMQDGIRTARPADAKVSPVHHALFRASFSLPDEEEP